METQENKPNEVLMGLFIKLRECKKEFQEQAGVISECNPLLSYKDMESKFHAGMGECLSIVGYFICEYATNGVYNQIPEKNPNVITFDTNESPQD
ncbi:hypothetical protein EZS27_012265 [termite gut metagenome]|uniref:Uncharacterized protein n=1 Tax=termite gut metagenome TaxID=433724 RepID=A0A5J4S163_9ZZZZ